ncbi:MAG TPA: hypothetical protein VFW38_08190 [Solirubrobacteraceae bacterium]|nr:hypothetical protein [Solirubrobacteraceae bacterium]
MTIDPADSADTVQPLTRVLLEALRTLGEGGQPETANRLAGRAWAVLRHARPTEARRVGALMHRLARMPSDPTRDQGEPRCLTNS